MYRSLVLVGIIVIGSIAHAEEDVVALVSDIERSAVIQKNELIFEERIFHALPAQYRIAKLNTGELEKAGSIVSFTLLKGMPPLKFLSQGVSRSNDKWGQWTGTIVSDSQVDNIHVTSDGVSDTAHLNITTWIYDGDSDEYFDPPLKFNKADIGKWTPESKIMAPFPIGPGTRIVNGVSGEWSIYTDSEGWTSYRIEALENDRDHVLIYKMDAAKHWDVAEADTELDAETFKRFSEQKAELEEHLKVVEKRIRTRQDLKE